MSIVVAHSHKLHDVGMVDTLKDLQLAVDVFLVFLLVVCENHPFQAHVGAIQHSLGDFPELPRSDEFIAQFQILEVNVDVFNASVRGQI